jgi:hypothetical protein
MAIAYNQPWLVTFGPLYQPQNNQIPKRSVEAIAAPDRHELKGNKLFWDSLKDIKKNQ